MPATLRYPCPCCGYLVFSTPPGGYELCPVCDWEDDDVQLAFPMMPGGANSDSLYEHQQTFLKVSTPEFRATTSMRPPQHGEQKDPQWRPLDPVRDRYLRDSPEDRALRRHQPPNACLYWWRKDYWLSDAHDPSGQSH